MGCQLQMQTSVTVQESLCIFLPCTIRYPQGRWNDLDLVYGYWFQEGANINLDAPVATNNPRRKVQTETQGRFHLLGDPRKNSCSLDIRDARMRDNGSYFFHMERGSMSWNCTNVQLSLHVTAMSQKPYIKILGSLESGRPSTLTCPVPWACDRGKAPVFTWIGASIPPGDSKITNSSVLTLIPRPQDHGTSLTCQVTFPGSGVITKKTILLKVTYSPQNVTITVFPGKDTVSNIIENGSSLHVEKGQYLRLVCVASSNPPSRLSWARGSLTLSPSKPSDPGVLELPKVEAGDGGAFTCVVQHPLGTKHVSFSLSVQSSSSCCRCASWEKGYRVLIFTLIRGALIGSGFLLTFGITWIYYTRCSNL
ncbi:PREDICTED: sialic acid-binding Ig-like lectin 8-like [Chrysochloris asiatica]|uniref:Sialic acid-binding Ig-like lectin 8-like n=1 Tax=Chrysochloris asiatica TaxID=185453 RepID=A0A9B0TVA7_CHRAS|nr:PREDICTED: sialic acid-binding Ig-like lectin 8-like [Chrysochloris asiatica]